MLSIYFTLYRAPVDTSPATEGVTLFKYRWLLLLLLLLLLLEVTQYLKRKEKTNRLDYKNP